MNKGEMYSDLCQSSTSFWISEVSFTVTGLILFSLSLDPSAKILRGSNLGLLESSGVKPPDPRSNVASVYVDYILH